MFLNAPPIYRIVWLNRICALVAHQPSLLSQSTYTHKWKRNSAIHISIIRIRGAITCSATCIARGSQSGVRGLTCIGYTHAPPVMLFHVRVPVVELFLCNYYMEICDVISMSLKAACLSKTLVFLYKEVGIGS